MEKCYLVKSATVYTIKETPNVMDVLVVGGKIAKISKKIVNKNAIVIDGKDKFLFPGFIDVHTHLGLYDEGTGWAGNDANEKSEIMTPHIRALDGVYPLDSGFKDAIQAGVTCVHVMPGSANIIGGTSSVIKTYGKCIDSMIVKKTAGLKIALGENPKKHHSNNGDITRMGILGLLREKFLITKHDLSESEKKLPRHSPIIKALTREIPVRIHAHRADDILSAVRFAKEFDLDLRIEHCTEGHLIADELKGNVQHVSVGPTMTRRSKIELRNKSWSTYASLMDRGINISITTDHPYIPIQYLNIAASIAVREGLSEDAALEAITINPAKNLGVENRVGSIEVGKDADLVLWSHHPFNYMAKPTLTMVDGRIVFESN